MLVVNVYRSNCTRMMRRSRHPYQVFQLRALLAVPYFEKALYEHPDLTPESIIALADQVEHDIVGGLAARPLLSVPHILRDESSCYYHGYVLAEMAVQQTRKHFGYISWTTCRRRSAHASLLEARQHGELF